MSAITESLVDNSKSAIIGCIELHNKPIFSYRYEVCTILAINEWELLLKAFIAENYPDVKLIKKDNSSKPFDECVSFVSSQLGKDFRATEENLLNLYEYRCHIIHFYKDSIEAILYSLLHKSILFYNDFLRTHFNIDLSEETNLILLPIGFKPFASPIDFLKKESSLSTSSYAVNKFIENIIKSTQELNSEGIEEPIITGFNVAVINENRIKNADIIVGITKKESDSSLTVKNIISSINITNDESAKKIRIEEETLFNTIYTLSYQDVVKKSREIFSDFLQNAKFNRIMKSIKGNPTFHRKRFLDVTKQEGSGKDYYSSKIFDELSNHYKKE